MDVHNLKRILAVVWYFNQARTLLTTRKQELEEVLRDMEQRIEEEEERMTAVVAEKKKLQSTVQDLEEQYVDCFKCVS